MLVAIGVVTALAFWESQRESEAVLRDVGAEQAVVAAVVAASGHALASAEPEPGAEASAAKALLESLPAVARPPDEQILVAPPGSASLYASDGRVLSPPDSTSAPGVDALRTAIDRNETTVRLNRAQSADLGLLPRTSMAAIAHVDAERGRRWSIVAVGSAARPRDRETRAFWRFVLGVGLASLLVLLFGGMALRNQRKELDLERELAVTDVLRERDDRLSRAERAATLGTFAMGVLHEVATPLGIITGRAEQLASAAGLDERGTRAVHAIQSQVDRIEQVIRRFLDMARGGPPSLVQAPAAQIIRSAVALVEHRFAKASVTLETEAPSGVPDVQCDRHLLEQAIVNLLLNACDACARGGHVMLAAREEGMRVAFVVTDDGVGITPANAERAKEPFFTTKPAGAGTGLGLAIAAEIAKSHRGELTIAPNGARGTRACIEIPAIAPVEDNRVD